MTGKHQTEFHLNQHKLEQLDNWMQAVKARPRVDELIQGLVPAKTGLILLGGRTGLGKTNLALQLACCVATGEPFLGHKTRKAEVGYLGFEGTHSQMADRMAKLLVTYPNAATNMRFGLSSLTKLTQASMEKFITWFEGVGLVILDPLKYLVQGDYGKPMDAQYFLWNAHELSARLPAPILMNHHIRKPDERALLDPGDLYELKGAGDYVDAATTVLFLERERQGHKPGGGFAPVNRDNTVLYFPKTRDAIVDEEPLLLRFNRDKLIFEERSVLT